MIPNGEFSNSSGSLSRGEVLDVSYFRCDEIWRYDGNSWTFVAKLGGFVSSFVKYQDVICVFGSFTSIDDKLANGFAVLSSAPSFNRTKPFSRKKTLPSLTKAHWSEANKREL